MPLIFKPLFLPVLTTIFEAIINNFWFMAERDCSAEKRIMNKIVTL